jgi:transposase
VRRCSHQPVAIIQGVAKKSSGGGGQAHWLTVEWLPKYAPELNDIELVWRDLKGHHLAHQTFADTDALDRAIHHVVDELNLAGIMHGADGSGGCLGIFG